MRNLARKPLTAAALAAAALAAACLTPASAAASPPAAPASPCAWQARITQTGKPVLRVLVTFTAHGQASALYGSNRVALKFGIYADVVALGCGKLRPVQRLPWRTVCQVGFRKIVIDRGGQPAWAYCITVPAR